MTLSSERIFFFVPPSLLAALIELVVLAILAFLLRKLYLRLIGGKREKRDWKTIIISNQTDIGTLAAAYGIPWKKLAKVNRLRPPYMLRQGDRIQVPAGRPVIKSGRSLPSMPRLPGKQSVGSWRQITVANQTDIETLSRAYGISWKELAKHNKLDPP